MFNDSAPHVLFYMAMNNTVRERNPEIFSLERLEELYKNDLIRPLLEFGKLAALGLHQRTEELEQDSDDEEGSQLNFDHEKLRIEVDWD